MLIKDYTYFLLKIISAGLLSAVGIVSILLLICAFVWLFKAATANRLRLPGFWLLLLCGLGAFGLAFNNGVYVYDERPETLVIEALAGEPTCGVAQAAWIRSGYGMGNPCPPGCFRGKILQKELRMRGFPPWPQYRRKMQCWTRE